MEVEFVSSISGKKFNFNKYINELARTQDIQSWIKRSPNDCNLQDWIIKQIAIKLRYSQFIVNK